MVADDDNEDTEEIIENTDKVAAENQPQQEISAQPQPITAPVQQFEMTPQVAALIASVETLNQLTAVLANSEEISGEQILMGFEACMNGFQAAESINNIMQLTALRSAMAEFDRYITGSEIQPTIWNMASQLTNKINALTQADTQNSVPGVDQKPISEPTHQEGNSSEADDSGDLTEEETEE